MKFASRLTFSSYMKNLRSHKFCSSASHSIAVCLLLFLLGAGLSQTAVAQQRSEEPLTNASVIKLVHAGFKDKTVVALLRSRPVHFDLTPDRLINLKKNGVSERLILAMIARDEGTLSDSSFASDDTFFDEGMGSPKKGNKTADGSTDIFGSSGGSSGRSRQRGGSGANDQDTETVGSASVHILRPATEGEGGTPKLEKTPTLNNASVVSLVEAGFSEGTIIRRIEQSPADFDLSIPALAELRKRRVNDSVIAAMRVAMGDDSGTRKTPSVSPEK